MRARVLLLFGLTVAALCGEQAAAQQTLRSKSDEALLTLTQERTFQYFWSGAESNSMAARERIHLDAPEKDQTLVTSGGTGFGLMAILVGIERGFVAREDAVRRLQRILNFLKSADRFHGAWPHWIHGDTGRMRPFSPKDDGGDLVETSFLAQGLLCVRQYFAEGNTAERELAALADDLWRGIEWNWYRGADQEDVLFWHWSPKNQWQMNFRIRGYNECLITYVLAASSPTHAIPASVYHSGWADAGKILADHSAYGITIPLKHQGVTEYCGPLFWSHYSFLGLDPRQLKDRYADYWSLNRDHVRMVRRYCMDNPGEFRGYSAQCWGLTSSYSLRGYRGHRPGNDEGTIAPTAALSSMPYTPKETMEVLRHLHDTHGTRLFGRYGFYDAFNEGNNWFPQRYLAIDQGPIVIMIENQRSGLLWRLFMSSPEVQRGLQKLGFQTQ
ncbi:MAG: glucoamylase family protein [Planctomycetota bacterium]